jgi:hypothetical protein
MVVGNDLQLPKALILPITDIINDSHSRKLGFNISLFDHVNFVNLAFHSVSVPFNSVRFIACQRLAIYLCWLIGALLSGWQCSSIALATRSRSCKKLQVPTLIPSHSQSLKLFAPQPEMYFLVFCIRSG